MTTKSQTVDLGRLVSGLLLAALGLLFWLDELGRFEVREIWDLWPLALVAIGLGKILSPECRGSGWVILTIGLLFVLDLNLDILSIDQTWPLLLVVAGSAMAWRALRDGSRPKSFEERS